MKFLDLTEPMKGTASQNTDGSNKIHMDITTVDDEPLINYQLLLGFSLLNLIFFIGTVESCPFCMLIGQTSCKYLLSIAECIEYPVGVDH
jgi:hypothetical protein